MKCTTLFIKSCTGFSGSTKCSNWWWMKCTKLVEYEFFEIGGNLNMNIPEFALSQLLEHKLCVSVETHADAVVLVARVVFVWLVVWYVWFIKLGCIRCCCGMKGNILKDALSLLCLLCMKFLMPSVVTLCCMRCTGWKK